MGEAAPDDIEAGGRDRFTLIRMTPDSDFLGVGLGVGDGISGVGLLRGCELRFGERRGAAALSGARDELPAGTRGDDGFTVTDWTAGLAAVVRRATSFLGAAFRDAAPRVEAGFAGDFFFADFLTFDLAALRRPADAERFSGREARAPALLRPDRAAGLDALFVAEVFRFAVLGRCCARARFLVV
jgi:hypothetical protein